MKIQPLFSSFRPALKRPDAVQPEAALEQVTLSGSGSLSPVLKLKPVPIRKFSPVDSRGWNLGNLGGNSSARREFTSLVESLKQGQSPVFHSYLLTGFTGSGKSTAARALAAELETLGIPSLHAQAADFTQDGPARLQQFFEQARQKAADSPSGKALLLLDEVEGLARIRSSQPDLSTQLASGLSGIVARLAMWAGGKWLPQAQEVSHFQQQQLLHTLSAELEKSPELLVVATTSRPDTMDLEATQRFHRRVDCEVPSGPEERLSILRAQVAQQGLQVDAGVLEEIAQATPGDNPGKLERGLRLARGLGSGRITSESAREARLTENFGAARPVTDPDWMWRLTICHELGHVVVRHLFEEMAQEQSRPDNMPKGIDAVSFAPRGGANASVFLKSANNPAKTFEWYISEIASNLAGRTAESLFGEGHLSAGPGNDIQFATSLTREAVREKAMGLTLGPVNAFTSPDTEARASADEERIRNLCDQVASSSVQFYQPFIESFSADMLTRKEHLEQLTVAGDRLKQQLKEWEQSDSSRAARLVDLKVQIRQEIEAIKPARSPELG